jgi:hypothetical protein
VAWDGNVYQGAPPAGWHLAGDGRWWPQSSVPSAPELSPAGRPSNRTGCLIGGAVGAIAVVVVGIAIILFASSDDTPTESAGESVGTTASPTSDPGLGTGAADDAATGSSADPSAQEELDGSSLEEDLAAFFDDLPPEELESLCRVWEADPDAITEVLVATYQAQAAEEGGVSALSEEELSDAGAAAISDACT